MEWKDVFAEIIALVAVIVTVATVAVAWLLTKTYSAHVDELRKVGADYQKLLEEQISVVERNDAVTNKTVLSLRTLFDLVMIKFRIETYERRLDELSRDYRWGDASLSADDASMKAVLVRDEIDRVNRAVLARQTELYWLVGSASERTAHLHALIDTNGDARSLDLLENFAALSQSEGDKEEMIQAVAALRQRLGKPRRLRRTVNFSNRWTGRTD